MGEVYRAEDTALKRPVALKRIAPRLQADKNYRQRFLREAQCASGLSYQHIAGIYDVLEANGEIFLVMEYVEGATLRQRLSRPLSVEQFLKTAVQCAAALSAAHERGIVHRDIKPENIMLTPAGQVKILDFGVAKQLPRTDDTVSVESLGGASGTFGGTPTYMAPEVLLEKEPDPRADVFSLGVVFYEALSGEHPFRTGNFLATMDRILHEVPPPLRERNPKVPPELERIVAKMLAKDSAERYATAADLVVDLRAVERAAAHPEPSRTRSLPASRRAQRWWSLAAAAALVVVVIFLLVRMHPLGQWFGSPGIAGPKNLVVLPFQAIGKESENQAYSDGMTETLTAKLTQLTAAHQLQVAPAREVRARRVLTAAEARKQFGASLVLEGTMYRSGNTVRVNYALVDTSTLRQLRADTITADVSDPFAVQDHVAEAVVQLLALELKPQERQALKTHGTQVAGAYDFYLQGRGYLQNYDKPESVVNAISVFERALTLDPNYALAHAGLGEAYWLRYGASKETRWIAAARKACERALTLEAKLAPAHICLGTIEDGTGHPENAVGEFRKALETEPTNDQAYRALGSAYEHLGKLAEAEQTYRQAIALRPHYWAGYNWLGVFYYHRAQYQEAVEMFEQVTALAPDNARGLYNLGASYVGQGRYAEAIAAFERSIAIRPTDTAYTNLGNAYFYLRRYDEATRAYEQAIKLGGGYYMLWWNLAEGYYWTPGKRPQAASAYRQAISLGKERLRVNSKDASALSVLAFCHAMLGERKPALEYLQRGLQLASEDPEMRFKAALVYNQFGDVDQTLWWLEKALAAGYGATAVRDTPNFDPLRANPRFQELLRAK